ncbi:MAG: hypothetical protein JSR78_07805 [Proteobacteria bacterium]|nr:hypothetical protein [Pseudomonadota bacterium]
MLSFVDATGKDLTIMSDSWKLLIAAAVLTFFTSDANASEYKFRVSCGTGAHVEKYSTGIVDPGKEYWRVVAGTANGGCSVSDYNDSDAGLPENEHHGAEAGGQAVKPLIPLILPFLF